MSSHKPGKDGFTLSCIAVWNGLSFKEIGQRTKIDPKRVSRLLHSDELKPELFEELLPAAGGTPADVAGATACFEALEPDPDLTAEERAVIESEILARSRRDRAILKQLALRSRESPPPDVYPEAGDVEPALWRAAGQMARLREIPPEHWPAAVATAAEFQTWALCVQAGEASRSAASQDLEAAAAWARVAVAAAERMRGPEDWRSRLQGMALGVEANVRRVEGKLKAARAGLREAMPLWGGVEDLQGIGAGEPSTGSTSRRPTAIWIDTPRRRTCCRRSARSRPASGTRSF